MGMHDPLHVCIKCGHVGQPENIITGSFVGEICLWIITAMIGSMSTWYLLLGPMIYSIYRISSKKQGCSLCKCTDIIPADSPNGKELITKKNIDSHE